MSEAQSREEAVYKLETDLTEVMERPEALSIETEEAVEGPEPAQAMEGARTTSFAYS